MAALTDAADVDAAFEAAAEVARSLTPSTDDRLKLYGLYKFNEANAQHIIAAVRDSLTELVRQLEDTDAKT